MRETSHVPSNIRLIPVLFEAAWSVMPGVAIMVLIVGVLRAMLKKLLG